MSQSRPVARRLPPALKSLVRASEGLLGEVIAAREGTRFLRQVEGIRRLMVRFREDAAEPEQRRALDRAQAALRRLAPRRRLPLARAYTIYLELLNACENAYRTHRLRERFRSAQPPVGKADIVYVLTAHPTESRSPANVWLMRRVQEALTSSLERGAPPDREAIKHLLHLIWRVGTFPPHKPAVEDEARLLISLISDPVLDEMIELRRAGHVVRLRTWVGGDRDGHPGVGPEQTRASLNISRRRLLYYFRHSLLLPFWRELGLMADEPLRAAWEAVERSLEELAEVRDADGERVRRFRARLRALRSLHERRLGHDHPSLERAALLLETFPALVVPLELREGRGRFGAKEPIAAMLAALRALAAGGDVGWYARGLVVSMAESARDLLEALALVERVFGKPLIPIVPLFETPGTVARSAAIIDEAFSAPAFRRAVRRYRRGRLEIMLGYSDTAKRMGAFPSRLALQEAIRALAAWGRRHGVDVIFFHGAGGSEGRGGGSIEDQASTWTRDALRLVKLTVQGEMVERTLATPEIFRGQVLKIAQLQGQAPPERRPCAFTSGLCARIQAAFARMAQSEDIGLLLGSATPYARLQSLTIGSRPASRGKEPSLENLRAIPWILCWTQVRYLVPVWLGVGSAWEELRRKPGARAALRRALARDPLLRGCMHLLGFTMVKTRPIVFERYVRELSGRRGRASFGRLERERRSALDLARACSPGANLLHFRPWLAESVHYRAPMIHPLNLLQLDLLKKPRWSADDELLFREVVTGIAAGMLTTG